MFLQLIDFKTDFCARTGLLDYNKPWEQCSPSIWTRCAPQDNRRSNLFAAKRRSTLISATLHVFQPTKRLSTSALLVALRPEPPPTSNNATPPAWELFIRVGTSRLIRCALIHQVLAHESLFVCFLFLSVIGEEWETWNLRKQTSGGLACVKECWRLKSFRFLALLYSSLLTGCLNFIASCSKSVK